MQAIILAAGMGKRLKELTQNNTKCMVKVNGVTLCERVLKQLDKQNLKQIVVVVGYRGQQLIDYINSIGIKTPIKFINNIVYDKTNNIYSLYLAKDELCSDDTLLLESDLIFEDAILEDLINDPRQTLALVDKYESWMDGTVVRLDENDRIKSFIPGKEMLYLQNNDYYKTVNIYKFAKDFSKNLYIPYMEKYMKDKGLNEYYETVLKVVVGDDKDSIQAKKIENKHLWYEIDDVQDLDIACSMFDDPEDRLEKIECRFGGFWRYPHMVDFCYLVNPYFPPVRMKYEMKASFDRLLTQYPSGMRVNSLLAAKNFGVKQEHIVVGNGAAELIKSAMEKFEAPFGFIRPTFEEYPNRRLNDKNYVFQSEKDGFKYDENDIINFYKDKDVNTLVLINPDNPSGNYISKTGLLKLIDWAKEKQINFIIDESFVDFADDENASIIDEEIIGKYDKLIVVKSISKSYGVPGLRLGILVSSNSELISFIKKDVSIWNINSFGEFYLQIEQKYHKDYLASCEEFRKERRRFKAELHKISALKVFESQANYFLIELNGISAHELSVKLLQKDFLIKDLSNKIRNGKQYIRIAIRDRKDNNALISALKDIL